MLLITFWGPSRQSRAHQGNLGFIKAIFGPSRPSDSNQDPESQANLEGKIYKNNTKDMISTETWNIAVFSAWHCKEKCAGFFNSTIK